MTSSDNQEEEEEEEEEVEENLGELANGESIEPKLFRFRKERYNCDISTGQVFIIERNKFCYYIMVA